MATALHLVTRAPATLAAEVVRRQLEAGDRVDVILLEDAPSPPLPAGVTPRRVPADLGYHELVDLLFAADRVTTW